MRAPMETPISGKLAANVFSLGKAAFGKEKRRQKERGHLINIEPVATSAIDEVMQSFVDVTGNMLNVGLQE